MDELIAVSKEHGALPPWLHHQGRVVGRGINRPEHGEQGAYDEFHGDQFPQPFAGGGERACARLAVRRALIGPRGLRVPGAERSGEAKILGAQRPKAKKFWRPLWAEGSRSTLNG